MKCYRQVFERAWGWVNSTYRLRELRHCLLSQETLAAVYFGKQFRIVSFQARRKRLKQSALSTLLTEMALLRSSHIVLTASKSVTDIQCNASRLTSITNASLESIGHDDRNLTAGSSEMVEEKLLLKSCQNRTYLSEANAEHYWASMRMLTPTPILFSEWRVLQVPHCRYIRELEEGRLLVLRRLV